MDLADAPWMRPLGVALIGARRLRGMKQDHAAELLRVTQPTVSRIERGELVPAGKLRDRVLDLVCARLDPTRDAALKRLVEGAAAPVHLICDLTHRLLAASRRREREWGRDAADLVGVTARNAPPCTLEANGYRTYPTAEGADPFSAL